MPIKIYRQDEDGTEVAWLCSNEWALPPQILELERWITARAEREAVDCIADIGFQWRRNAMAGGSTLDAATLKKLGDFGITLFLSEYPGFAGEDVA